MTPPFTAAILCGGASRRMGRDKALLAIDGRSMAARVADAARAAGAGTVVAVGGDAVQLARLGLRVVPDREPGAGPLAATLTALDAADDDLVLVLGCDLVNPSPAAMATVVDALAAAPAGTMVAVPEAPAPGGGAGRPNWVHAAWRRAALPVLARCRSGGASALREAAEHLPVVTVTGLARAVLTDADVPGDLPGVGYARPMDVPEIDVAELARLHAAGAPVIDVREDDEFVTVRIPGVRHIPLGQVPERIGEVPTDRTVYVVCARGGRSAKAAEHYRAAGIDAVNVAGGTIAWVDAGHPTESGPA